MKFSLLKRICGVAMSETVQMGDTLISGAAVSGAVVLGLLFGGSLEKPREMVVFIFGQKVKVGRGVWCGAVYVVVEGTEMGRKMADGGEEAYQVWEMNKLMSPPPLPFAASTPKTVEISRSSTTR